MKIFQDEAFVLQSKKMGESDLIVSLLTLEGGKISGIAKGARRSKKRFGGSLELGSLIRVVYETRPKRDLCFFRESSLQRRDLPWRQSWMTIAATGYVLELALRLLPEQQPSLNKFKLLKYFIENLEESRLLPLLLFFEFRWLLLSGWGPNLERCGLCGRNSEGEGFWQLLLDRGEILCSGCKTGGTSLVSREGVRFLKQCGKGEILPLEREWPPEMAKIQRIFGLHWRQILGKPLKSQGLLEKALL